MNDDALRPMSWQHKIVRVLLALGVLCALVDIGDNVVLRVRVAKNWRPYGGVHVKRYLMIRQKNQKVEFVALGDETRRCSNTLLPQLGAKPCWYTGTELVERIEM